MTIDGMQFLYSTDKIAMCHHMTHMPRTQAEDHCEALDNTLRKHNKARFVVAVIHCDREFEPLMDEVKDNPSATMSCTNPHEHEPTMEHANHTWKGGV